MDEFSAVMGGFALDDEEHHKLVNESAIYNKLNTEYESLLKEKIKHIESAHMLERKIRKLYKEMKDIRCKHE